MTNNTTNQWEATLLSWLMADDDEEELSRLLQYGIPTLVIRDGILIPIYAEDLLELN